MSLIVPALRLWLPRRCKQIVRPEGCRLLWTPRDPAQGFAVLEKPQPPREPDCRTDGHFWFYTNTWLCLRCGLRDPASARKALGVPS